MQGWIIAWNGGPDNRGGWCNQVAYKDAVGTVESLIAQGVDPDKIVVNKCGIDHYSANAFLKQYGGKVREAKTVSEVAAMFKKQTPENIVIVDAIMASGNAELQGAVLDISLKMLPTVNEAELRASLFNAVAQMPSDELAALLESYSS